MEEVEPRMVEFCETGRGGTGNGGVESGSQIDILYPSQYLYLPLDPK